MTPKKNCSIRELAKYVNVSPGTVSRVLNNKASNVKITEATRKRIFAAVKELNYSPNIHAKRLFANKSMTIGIAIPDQQDLVSFQHTFSDFNLSESLSGIERIATANDYRLLLLVMTEEFMAEKTYLKLFHEKSIDGVIFWGIKTNAEFIQDLLDENLPFVLANSNNAETSAPTVVNDNISGSLQITELLIKKGCRRIAYLKGKSASPVNMDRETGFLRAMEDNKIKVDRQLVLQGDYSLESGYNAVNLALKDKIEFDALIAGNDMMAIGAMRALQQAGMKIPEDVAVAGADNIQLAEFAGVPLTTFFANMFALGSEAMKLLIAQMNNDKKTPKKIIIPIELVVRDSA